MVKQRKVVKRKGPRRTRNMRGVTKPVGEGLGYVLRSIREARKWKAVFAARKLGVSPVTVYLWEHGKCAPCKRTIYAIIYGWRLSKDEQLQLMGAYHYSRCGGFEKSWSAEGLGGKGV